MTNIYRAVTAGSRGEGTVVIMSEGGDPLSGGGRRAACSVLRGSPPRELFHLDMAIPAACIDALNTITALLACVTSSITAQGKISYPRMFLSVTCGHPPSVHQIAAHVGADGAPRQASRVMVCMHRSALTPNRAFPFSRPAGGKAARVAAAPIPPAAPVARVRVLRGERGLHAVTAVRLRAAAVGAPQGLRSEVRRVWCLATTILSVQQQSLC